MKTQVNMRASNPNQHQTECLSTISSWQMQAKWLLPIGKIQSAGGNLTTTNLKVSRKIIRVRLRPEILWLI